MGIIITEREHGCESSDRPRFTVQNYVIVQRGGLWDVYDPARKNTLLRNIKFCPCCGERLPESSSPEEPAVGG